MAFFFACHGRKQGHNRIIIKDGAYIGMNSSIISRREEGLIIGKEAIVGACSLVNRSVPDNKTVVGVPAKELNAVLHGNK
ncbi:acyltransferase [Bacteroides fragilis]